MRLMLHGRSGPSMLLNRIQHARKQRRSGTGPISTLLLSGWDDADNDDFDEVLAELCSFLLDLDLEEEQQPQHPNQPKEVILHNCHGEFLQTLVATILQSSSIRHLMIRYDKQQSKIPKSIVDGFLQGAAFSYCGHIKTLRSLSFRGVTLTLDNCQALRIALRELPCIGSLSFKCNFLLTDIIQDPLDTIRRKKQQQHLYSSHQIIASSPTVSLLESPLVMRELIGMIQNLPLLRSLELENCHIGDEEMARLFYVLQNGSSPKLEVLKLRGNRCQEQSMESLKHWLMMPGGRSKHSQQFQHQPACHGTKNKRGDLHSTPTATSFSSSSSSSPSFGCALTHLDLSWQFDPEAAMVMKNGHAASPYYCSLLEGCYFLAEGLAHNQSLQTLIVSENRIKSDDMAVVSRALVRNKSLKKLVLKDCRITLTGLALLAQNLHKFHLESLQLHGQQRLQGPQRRRNSSSNGSNSNSSSSNSNCRVKDLLLRPMTRNVYLQELLLPENEPVSSSLNYLLEWNRAGRRVLLDSKFPNHLWPYLLARADKVGRNDQRSKERAVQHGATAIYYLFREKASELLQPKQQEQQ